MPPLQGWVSLSDVFGYKHIVPTELKALQTP